MKTNLTLLLLLLAVFGNAQETSQKPQKIRGYYNYTSFGTLIGSANDEQPVISSVLMEHNYQFNPKLAIGVATGLEWFDVRVLPIGPNLKILMPKPRQSAFFWAVTPGYAFALEDIEFMDVEVTDTKGGAFFNTELGYLLASQKDYNIFIAIGYRYHEFEFTRSDWLVTQVSRKTTYNRFSVRMGIRLF